MRSNLRWRPPRYSEGNDRNALRCAAGPCSVRHRDAGHVRPPQLDVKRLLLEGGGGANGDFLHVGLVDELNLILCPAVDGRERGHRASSTPRMRRQIAGPGSSGSLDKSIPHDHTNKAAPGPAITAMKPGDPDCT
jgi:hypothetical protein